MPYQLKDEFSNAQAAPLPSPLNASGTGAIGQWTVTDTGNVLHIAEGQLQEGGNSVYNDPALWAQITDVGIVAVPLRLKGNLVTAAVFAHTSASPANPHTSAHSGLRFTQVGTSYAVHHAPTGLRVSGTSLAERTRSIDYLVVIAQRPEGGTYVLASGGMFGAFPQATLIWASPVGTPNWLGITGDGSNNSWDVDFVHALAGTDLSAPYTTQFGLAEVWDAFDGVGSIDGRLTQDGNYTWAITTGAAHGGTISNGVWIAGDANVFGYVDRGQNAQIIEATFTAFSTDNAIGNMFFGVVCRGVGTTQSDFIRFAWFGSTQTWVIWDGSNYAGSDASNPPVAGQTYTFRLIDNGTTLNGFIYDHSGGFWWQPIIDSNVNGNVKAAGTRIGVYSGGTDRSEAHHFASWPRSATLPSDLLTRPPLAAPVGDVIASDTFSRSGNLHNSTTEVGNLTWSAFAGSWSANGSVASRSTTGDHEGLLIDPGSVDHAIEATISLPGGTAETMAGLYLSFIDINNFVHARFLNQGGTSEIEIWQRVAGNISMVAFTNHGFAINGTTRDIRAAVRTINDDGVSRREVSVWERANGSGIAFDESTVFAQGAVDMSLASGALCGFGTSGAATAQATYDTVSAWQTAEAPTLTAVGAERVAPYSVRASLGEQRLARYDVQEFVAATITWREPAADSELSGNVILRSSTDDTRVTRVRYLVDGVEVAVVEADI